MSWKEIIASLLILNGVAFNILGAVGLLRFQSTLPRMHAATKPVTLGFSSVLLGSALALPDIGDSAQLLLAVAFQFITAPIAAHMVGRAVYRTDRDARNQLSVDELGLRAEEDDNENSGRLEKA